MPATEEFINALITKESIKADYVKDALITFIKAKIPGAPPLNELLPAHARAVNECEDFVEEVDEDWNGFYARKKKDEEAEKQTSNIFIPFWADKRDNQSVFARDTNIDSGSSAEEYWTTLCIENTPDLTTSTLAELLEKAPCSQSYIVEAIADATANFLPFFIKPIGREESDFKWARTITTLSGLGRAAANRVFIASGEEGLRELANKSKEEYADIVKKARSLCGYPASLYRLPFTKIQNKLGDENKIPDWYGTILLLHLLKHTRYYAAGENSYFYVAFKGRHAYIPISTSGLNQPLGHMINRETAKALCDVLRIQYATTNDASAVEQKAVEVFKYVLPAWIPAPVEMRVRSDIITPPGITFKMAGETANTGWINTGLEVHNLASIDIATGKVNKFKTIVGADTIALKWPRECLDLPCIMNWRSALPSVVNAQRPSELLTKYIRNINVLDNREGFNAMVDAIVLLDLIRDDIAGSEVGSCIFKEFPFVWVLPMGSTADETTNQGKTNLARVLSNTLVPNLPVTVCSSSSSAPVQRAIASPLEMYGTAIFDEFNMPRSPDHFLNQSGLQALATGGRVNPGRAMENSPGVWLRHPLFIVSKFCVDIPDILNRQFSIFLDTLTEENRSNEAELDAILSGKIPTLMRLAALRWIAANDFVNTVKKLGINGGIWRFNGHATVAAALSNKAAVSSYLTAAKAQAELQRANAVDGELPYQMGIMPGFDFKWYWDNCGLTTLSNLFNSDKILRLNQVIRAVVSDDGDRNMESELRKFGLMEQGATAKLSAILKKGPLERDGYKLTMVMTRGRPHATLTKVGISKMPENIIAGAAAVAN